MGRHESSTLDWELGLKLVVVQAYLVVAKNAVAQLPGVDSNELEVAMADKNHYHGLEPTLWSQGKVGQSRGYTKMQRLELLSRVCLSPSRRAMKN